MSTTETETVWQRLEYAFTVVSRQQTTIGDLEGRVVKLERAYAELEARLMPERRMTMATEEMELHQISFHQAVYDDETMPIEQKLYWLKACADQYLEQLETSERAVNILRGGMQVIEGLCAEGQHEMIALSSGVALRATNPHRGYGQQPPESGGATKSNDTSQP